MAEQVEEWKTITDYDMYEVSNMGNVRKNYKNGKVRILKPKDNCGGYFQAALCKGGEKKRFYIHRLVAMAFIEQVGGKLTVDHIDRDRTNNNIHNLRWANYTEQNRNTCVYRDDIEETDPKLRRAIFREERKEKITCECGVSVARSGIAKHRITERHLKLMRGEPAKVDRCEKMTCECGDSVSRRNISTHKKSKKHIKLMEEQNNN